MPAAAPHPAIPPAETLARIIDDLCKSVAAHGIRGLMTRALLFLLWGRLRRTALRVRRLAARIAAGESLLPRRRRPQPPRPGRPSPPRLPRGYAWVVRMVPGTAAYGTQLQVLLTDPDMAALAATPAMGRLLRPLCQMLGVPKPPIQRPVITPAPPAANPPPPRRPRPKPAPRATSGQGDPQPPTAAPKAA